MAAAGVQEGVFFGRVAQLVDHGLRDHRARAEEETRALDSINLARRVVDFPAKRMREGVVQREARPGADVNLLVLGIHRVFRQRLQMLPAAQRTEPSHVSAIMDGEVAAVALAEHGAFGMGRPQLAALRNGLAVGPDQPLCDIEAAALAFGHADDRGQFGALHGFANFVGLRAVK